MLPLTIRKILIALLSIALLIYTLFFWSDKPVAHAAPRFAQAIVKLERTATSSPLSGTICAQPSGSGAENKLTVQFPSSVTISSNVNNWTNSNTNLPQGSTFWPGIGTHPTNVSGTTLTFTSNNLTAGTLYCFRFTTTSSQLPSTAAANLEGDLISYTITNAIIDDSSFSLVVTPDQIGIQATVGVSAEDFFTSISTGTSNAAFYSDDTELEFTINYGNTLTYDPTPYTLYAEWEEGTIEESNTTADILEYVPGSATNAYGNTAPVIDPINKRIIWYLPTLPSGLTTSTVSFRLKFLSNYTGSKKVVLPVHSRALVSTVYSPDSTVTVKYLYKMYSPNTHHHPGPTATPTPIPSATPTPAPLAAPKLNSVNITSISPNKAHIRVETDSYTSLFIRYGKDPQELSKSLTTPVSRRFQEFELPNLDANTQYYFTVTASNANKKTRTSEIYTFKTAQFAFESQVDATTLLITSLGNIVFAPSYAANSTQPPTVMLPEGIPYEVNLGVKKGTSIKNISLFTRNAQVLGLVDPAFAEPNSENIQMLQTQPGFFVGRLKTKPEQGMFTQYVRITDYFGNLSEIKLATLRVVPPLTIKDTSGKPIEGASILLSLYNPITRLYEELSPAVLPITNPAKTDYTGTASYALAPGQYRAKISALGYKTIEKNFTIGAGREDIYPTVTLLSTGASIIGTIRYFLDSFHETIASQALSYLDRMKVSTRFFDAFYAIFLLLSVTVTFISFRIRTKTPLSRVLHHIPFWRKTTQLTLNGRVFDDQTPLSRAQVFLINDQTQKVIAHTVSDAKGIFYMHAPKGENYNFLVLKDGYEPVTLNVKNTEVAQSVELVRNQNPLTTFRKSIVYLVETLAGGMFEVLLIVTIVVELIFMYTFGVIKVLPFLFGSMVNLWLWVSYLRSAKLKYLD